MLIFAWRENDKSRFTGLAEDTSRPKPSFDKPSCEFVICTAERRHHCTSTGSRVVAHDARLCPAHAKVMERLSRSCSYCHEKPAQNLQAGDKSFFCEDCWSRYCFGCERPGLVSGVCEHCGTNDNEIGFKLADKST